MAKLINTTNGSKELSSRLECYLMLKRGESASEKVLLYISLMKLSTDKDTIENLLKAADFTDTNFDKYHRDFESDKQISEYLIDMLENPREQSLINFNKKFQKFLESYWSNGESQNSNISLKEIYGHRFPENDLGSRISLLNRE